MSADTSPAAMPGEIERLERALRHAATTASNDDYTKAGTVERARHVNRVTAMLEAADALRAFAPILAEKERMKVEKQGAVDRGLMMFEAKNEWRARALAAEAALAAERERAAKVIDYRVERLRGNRKRIAQIDQHVISIMESLAAAIRAQGE